MSLQQLLQRKGEIVTQMRELLNREEAESRELTAEENQQYETLDKELNETNAKIDAMNRADERRRRLGEAEEQLRDIHNAPPLARQPEGHEPVPARTFRERVEAGQSRREALAAVAAGGSEPDLRMQGFRYFLMHGRLSPDLQRQAALQLDSDTAGGYLQSPEQFVARIIMDLDNAVAMRPISTVIPLTGAESIGVPTLDTDVADSDWTTELAVGTADSAMVFGKRRLTPHPLAKHILVSKDLLRSAAVPVDSLVRERLSYKFGVTEEKAFLSGTGANQPLGVFTASAQGVTTTQDVSTGNTTTAITTDGLIECKYALTSPHLASPSLRWIFHRTAVKNIRKLKDGDGQYIWRPGLQSDTGDTILDIPIIMSEYAPSTFTTGLYVGILGNFMYYWIVDTMALAIERLVELGALTNQDYFIGRLKLDGAPVLSTAFARVKLA